MKNSRTYLLIGLAVALVATSFNSADVLARDSGPPTLSAKHEAKFTLAETAATLIDATRYDLAIVRAELAGIKEADQYFEKKSTVIRPVVKAAMDPLLSWRSWRYHANGDPDLSKADLLKTTVVNLPVKPYNTARWKDLHRRC